MAFHPQKCQVVHVTNKKKITKKSYVIHNHILEKQWETDWQMAFHPQKCQVVHVTNRKKITKKSYFIHNHILEEVDSAKYLGVHIHKNLSWNHHINSITNKVNSTWAFLQRSIYQCPRKTKEVCYMTLVRPIVEYSSIIWDPLT